MVRAVRRKAARQEWKVRALTVLAVRRNRQLAAIFPFAIYRKWNLVDVARVVGAPFCEYANVLLDRSQFGEGELHAVWQSIVRCIDADVIAVDDFPQASALTAMIGATRVAPSAARFSSLIEISRYSDWDDYKSSWSKSARRSRKKRFNKIANAGDLHFQVHDGASPEFCELFEKAQSLKVAWLREAALSESKLSCKRFRKFVCSLPGRATEPDGAVAAALYLDATPVAIEIGFCRQGHYFSYLGAFDPDYAHYSPGKALIGEVLKWAFQNGIRSYDFLGNPSQYKQDWSNRKIHLVSYRAGLNVLGAFYCLGTDARFRMLFKNVQELIPAGVRKFLVRLAGQSAHGVAGTQGAGR